LSDTLSAELLPLFEVMAPINEQSAAADRRIATLVAADPDMRRLATAPSIGPITASAIVTTVDDVTRFVSAHQFEAFLGLVPGERSSGEKRRIGRITKAGNSRVRYLLVEAGWRILRTKSDETAALRAWESRSSAVSTGNCRDDEREHKPTGRTTVPLFDEVE